MLYRKSIELVETGVVNVTYWPEPCRATALRYDASPARWPSAALGPMTVPLVAEFSACTSAYGRLAPLPPVAAAHAGAAARARTPPAASNAALLAKATTRLRFRMVLNTFAPFEAERRTFTGSAASQVDGGARTQGVTAVQSAVNHHLVGSVDGERRGGSQAGGTLGGRGTESGGT